MRQFKLESGKQIYHLTGELEMACSDQDLHDAKYAAVDVVLIGTAPQVERMLNRLNGSFDGGVETEELAKPPKRPTRPLQKGDRVSWTSMPDGERAEGVFQHQDSMGRGYVQYDDKTRSAYIPMEQLQYVSGAPYEVSGQADSATKGPIRPTRDLEYGDWVEWVNDAGMACEGMFVEKYAEIWNEPPVALVRKSKADTVVVSTGKLNYAGKWEKSMVTRESSTPCVEDMRYGDFLEWREYDARHNFKTTGQGHFRGVSKDGEHVIVTRRIDGRVVEIKKADVLLHRT